MSTALFNTIPSTVAQLFHSINNLYYYHNRFPIYNVNYMHITLLQLACFRNHPELSFKPSAGLNLLVGPNARGKSAILEAIYLLATSKSHRSWRDTDMIMLGENTGRAYVEVARQARNNVAVEVALSRTQKKLVKIDSVRRERIGDIMGELNVVIFSNSDIEMVKGEPARRRRFLNLEISQVRPQYVYSLGRYRRVLEQRSSLLKEIRSGTRKAEDLDVWDSQLAEYGASVIVRRREFIKLLAKSAAGIYAVLAGGDETLNIDYKPSLQCSSEDYKDIAASFFRELVQRRDSDIARGLTSVGPHRDDLGITISGIPAREYASQGQQRTAAIALKLAEIDIMKESAGEPPVVLLDDVMAELDDRRRLRVLELAKNVYQTIVTTTDLANVGGALIDDGSVFEVKSGEVTRA